MRALDVLIDVAATTRATRLVVNDEISRPAREKITEVLPDGRLEYLVNCPYCVSVWAGFAVQILPRPVVYALALSGASVAGRWLTDAIEGVIQ